MTSDSPTSASSPSLEAAPKPKTSSKRKGMSQERFMVMFTLFFIVGVLLLVVLPEGHAARGIVMAVYSILVFWSMFRFGM
jgi:hypothetical protein